MEIRGVGGVNPMEQPGGKPVKAAQASAQNTTTDSLNVSPQASVQRDEAFLNNVAARIRAIDEKLLLEVRGRLANGAYDKKEVIDALADKMIKALGL